MFFLMSFACMLTLVHATPLPEKNAMQLNPTEFDLQGSPCTDLNAFVNGKWLAKTLISEDQTGWGNFYILH